MLWLRGMRAPAGHEGYFSSDGNTQGLLLLLLQGSVKSVISEPSSAGERRCYKKQSDFAL